MNMHWRQLPGATHIRRLEHSFNTQSAAWTIAENFYSTFIMDSAENGDINYDAWRTALGIIRSQVYEESIEELREICLVDGETRFAFLDACTILLAYPEHAYMLDSDPDELKILAKFGNTNALLLLPACIAFSKEEK